MAVVYLVYMASVAFFSTTSSLQIGAKHTSTTCKTTANYAVATKISIYFRSPRNSGSCSREARRSGWRAMGWLLSAKRTCCTSLYLSLSVCTSVDHKSHIIRPTTRHVDKRVKVVPQQLALLSLRKDLPTASLRCPTKSLPAHHLANSLCDGGCFPWSSGWTMGSLSVSLACSISPLVVSGLPHWW